MRRRWFPALAGAAALAVGAATVRGRGRDLDDRLYRRLNADRGPAVDGLLRALTELGAIGASAGAAGVVAAGGRRREAVDALGAAAATWFVGQGLKRLFARLRPYDAMPGVRLLIGRPRGASWPSSHPAVLLAFLTVATRDLDAPPSVRWAALVLAGIVALSRVHLGVHYPADVVGGLLVGRGLADLWSSAVSPAVLGKLPAVEVPLPPSLVEEAGG